MTTDKGAWNRNMWGSYAIAEDQVSTENPAYSGYDEEATGIPSRRLWFCSDFPHLVKAVWSRVRTWDIAGNTQVKERIFFKEFQTPISLHYSLCFWADTGWGSEAGSLERCSGQWWWALHTHSDMPQAHQCSHRTNKLANYECATGFLGIAFNFSCPAWLTSTMTWHK